MKVSKKSQYGLRAMVCLAKYSKKNGILSLRQIAKEENIPFDFLEKIMGKLKQAGLVKAKKGVAGGYYLSKKPNKITPAEIIKALEEEVALVSCKGCDRARTCLAKDFWKDVDESLDSTFKATTLADLIHCKK